MVNMKNYRDQGFCGTAKQSATDALKQANREMHADIARKRFLAWWNGNKTEKWIEHHRKALELEYAAAITPDDSIAIDLRVGRAKEVWSNGEGLDAALAALEE